MGCIASVLAEKNKKRKVRPVPSSSTLRGDLITRGEARAKRSQGIADHHARTKNVAKTVAFNTMAEKEMMSTTSTERSYRSGRAFLLGSCTPLTDNNDSEKGPSTSGGSDRSQSKIDNVKQTSTLPYAVPEEEPVGQHDATGQLEVTRQRENQRAETGSPTDIETNTEETKREMANVTSADKNSLPQVEGHEVILETKFKQSEDANEGILYANRNDKVAFDDTIGNKTSIENVAEETRVEEATRTNVMKESSYDERTNVSLVSTGQVQRTR